LALSVSAREKSMAQASASAKGLPVRIYMFPLSIRFVHSNWTHSAKVL